MAIILTKVFTKDIHIPAQAVKHLLNAMGNGNMSACNLSYVWFKACAKRYVLGEKGGEGPWQPPNGSTTIFLIIQKFFLVLETTELKRSKLPAIEAWGDQASQIKSTTYKFPCTTEVEKRLFTLFSKPIQVPVIKRGSYQRGMSVAGRKCEEYASKDGVNAHRDAVSLATYVDRGIAFDKWRGNGERNA